MTGQEAIMRATQLRPIIEQAAQSLDDKVASTSAELFPKLKQDGSLVSAGTRINWRGTLKQATIDLWDTETNNPDNAPTLWQDIAYHDGIRIIPAVITAEQAFALDELGWQDGKVYRSKMHGNVFPVTQADAWEFVR